MTELAVRPGTLAPSAGTLTLALLSPWGAPCTVRCLAASLTSTHQCQHRLHPCHDNPVSPRVTRVPWGARSPPLLCLLCSNLPPSLWPQSLTPGPLTGHFPSRGSSGPGMSSACLPSCSLAAMAAEGAGRLSCLYSANKEANCSHQGGPLGWGELLRTLFLKIASWGCLSAHQACFASLSPGEGPPVTRGMARGLPLGMPLPHPIVGRQETRWVFQFGNKTRAWDSIESKFPSLTLCREAPGISM